MGPRGRRPAAHAVDTHPLVLILEFQTPDILPAGQPLERLLDDAHRVMLQEEVQILPAQRQVGEAPVGEPGRQGERPVLAGDFVRPAEVVGIRHAARQAVVAAAVAEQEDPG